MKIFVPHSSNFDFMNELYLPLRNSLLNGLHEFILPQENKHEVITRELIKDCDIVLAEVSYPSTGQGIELGWASMLNVPIACIYKEGLKYSPALRYITDIFIDYKSPNDMIEKITEILKTFNNPGQLKKR